MAKLDVTDDRYVLKIKIPAYGQRRFAVEEEITLRSDKTEVDNLLNDLDRFADHMNEARLTQKRLREMAITLTDEALESIMKYFTGTEDDPLSRRERVFYEMVLAEQVKRIPR